MSRGEYIYEPYWGICRLKIENGIFTEVNFIIRDSSLHEIFNGQYEKHFAGNPDYIQQSRNDWAGVQAYPKNYLKSRIQTSSMQSQELPGHTISSGLQ